MVTGIYGVNGVNGLSDPYFMNAWNSYNANAAAATSAAYNPTFNGSSQKTETPTTVMQTEEPKKKSKAGAVIGGVFAIGAAAFTIAAYRKGNGAKATEKICDGFKQFLGSAKAKATSIAKSTAKETANITKEADKVIVELPGQRNIIKGVVKSTEEVSATEAAKLTDIASSTTFDMSKLFTKGADGKIVLGDGITIKNGIIEHDGNVIEVVKGRIKSVVDKASGRSITGSVLNPVEKEEVALAKGINEAVANFMKGEGLENAKNIQFAHKADGISRLFTAENTQSEARLVAGVSKKLGINSTAVKAARLDSESLDKTIKDFLENKLEGLKQLRAEYKSPSIGTFHIENGEIAAVTSLDGVKHAKGSQGFKALMFDNKEAFENVLKKKPEELTNIVYKL